MLLIPYTIWYILIKLIIPYLYVKNSNHVFKYKLFRKIKDIIIIIIIIIIIKRGARWRSG